MADKFHRVAVIGVGLIGGSLALKMRQLKLAGEIIGVGRKLQNLKDARRIGALTGYTHDPAQGVKGADLVVLAVPIKAMARVVKAAAGSFMPGAIITDVGSAKAGMIKMLEPLLPQTADFIPAHPIAGREKSGAKFSDPELFQNRWVIITPSKRSSAKGVRRVRRLWEKLGAKIVTMKPEVHDRILAGVSHLPHVVAYSLVGALLELDKKTAMLRFSAGGFKDFTRIAASSPEMWRDICLENKPELLRAIRAYEKQMSRIKSWIEQDRAGQLLKFFEQCKKVREKIGD